MTAPGGPLRPLEGYGPWESVDVDEKEARHRANEYVDFLKGRLFQVEPGTYQALLNEGRCGSESI